MKTTSKKAKGSRFERFIAKEITQAGLGEAHRELMSGGGWRKGDIASSLPYLMEAKHQKKIRVLEWIDQARREAQQGNFDPNKWILVFNDFRKKPEFSEVYAVIDFWELLELLKKNSEPKIKQPDRQLKWEIQKLIQTAKQVIKKLEK